MTNISVIMPAYNCGKYIDEALRSVLAQTCQDLEVIVVDDGSTDQTGEVVRSLEEKWPALVRYLYQQNRGPGAARNTGMRNARGRYIAFLDADDRWLSHKLAKQIDALEKEQFAAMAYCDHFCIDAAGRELQGYHREIECYGGSIAPQLFQHYFVFPSSVLLRRECLERVGYFREDINVGEDYDYFLRIAYEFPVVLVREKLYHRRVLPESLSNRDWTVNAVNDLRLLTEFVQRRPEFRAQFRNIVDERLGSYHFDLGYFALRQGRNLFALQHLLQSLKYRRYPKTLKCMAMCLVPYSLLQGMRAPGNARE